MSKRTATIQRATKETKIQITLDLDGAGTVEARTGIGFLDHMLDHFGKHSMVDLAIQAEGDLHVDDHHTTEDVGICLGQSLRELPLRVAQGYVMLEEGVPLEEPADLGR